MLSGVPASDLVQLLRGAEVFAALIFAVSFPAD